MTSFNISYRLSFSGGKYSRHFILTTQDGKSAEVPDGTPASGHLIQRLGPQNISKPMMVADEKIDAFIPIRTLRLSDGDIEDLYPYVVKQRPALDGTFWIPL